MEGTDDDGFFPIRQSEVLPHHGAPALFVNGCPHSGLAFFFGRVTDSAPDIQRFAEAGIHVFSGCFGPARGAGGALDFQPLRERLEYVIAANPRVLILPRIGMHYVGTQHPWFLKYQDEMQVNVHPVTGQREVVPWFSFSSMVWREEVAPQLGQIVRWCEEHFGEHMLGYHVSAGAAGEFSYSWHPALSDYSAAQVRGFRRWLRERYQNDTERLRRAWAQPGADFDTAEVPLDRTCARGQAPLLDPARERSVIDYQVYHSAVMAEALTHCARIAKQALASLGRRKVCGAFYGYRFKNMNRPANCFNAGHFASDIVLNSPDVDFVCAPYDYTGREPGNMYMAQLVAGSVRVHGKLHWCEEDTFTFLSRREPGRSWCPDRETTVGVLRRNFMGFSREAGTGWYMDCGGNGPPSGGGQVHGWYRDEGLRATFANLQALARRRLDEPDRSPDAQVAVFLSDAGAAHFRHETALVDPLLFRQVLELGALGASFDVYRVEDLPRLETQPWWGNYRLLLFLDAVYVSPRDREIITRAAKRDRRTILWVYAAGLFTGETVDPRAMEDLTGLHVDVRRSAEALLVNCFLTGSRVVYGGERPVSPVVIGNDSQAHVAGWFVNTGDPGVLERDFGGWRSVWSGAPAVPAAVLRHLARQAGVHLYVETGDQVLADRGYLAVHAGCDGPRSIRLPGPCDIADADTGRTVARGATEFSVTMRRGETGVWRLGGAS